MFKQGSMEEYAYQLSTHGKSRTPFVYENQAKKEAAQIAEGKRLQEQYKTTPTGVDKYKYIPIGSLQMNHMYMLAEPASLSPFYHQIMGKNTAREDTKKYLRKTYEEDYPQLYNKPFKVINEYTQGSDKTIPFADPIGEIRSQYLEKGADTIFIDVTNVSSLKGGRRKKRKTRKAPKRKAKKSRKHRK